MNDSLNFSTQVMQQLLEGFTPASLFVAYIFTICGLFIKWYLQYKLKGKTNPRTPEDFKLGFWLRDNLLPRMAGILFTIIVIFLSFRFAQELAGKTFSNFYALTVGIGLDFIIDKLKVLSPHEKATKESGIDLI